MAHWKGPLARIVGALALALVGGCASVADVGDVLQPGDRTLIEATVQDALENNRTGEARSWTNEETGHHGSVTPLRTFKTSSGTDCRDYQQIVTISNRAHTSLDTACRRADGGWASTNYAHPADIWSYVRLRDSDDPIYAERRYYDHPHYGYGGYYGHYPGRHFWPRSRFGLSFGFGSSL